MKRRALALVTCLIAVIFPLTAMAQIAGDWEIRINKVIKKPPRASAMTRSELDTLKSKFVVEYRYDGGIPPKRFLVANGVSAQAFPQTLQGTTADINSFDLVFADIYEVCPSQFALVEEEDETIGVATLTMDANTLFRPSVFPGKSFHQLIVHDWGDLYAGLDGVSVLDFGTSLESMVLSAGLMMRDLRCAEATPEECADLVMATIRIQEPTEEQIDRGLSGGHEFHACPGASDNSPAAEPSVPSDPGTTFSLVSAAFDDEGMIPPVHACTTRGGSDVSPPLAWSNPPEGATAFALIVDDEFQPCGLGDTACRHWQVYNIPADVSAFDAGQNVTEISGVTQGTNWNQTSDYTGPCPPFEHVYTFTLYALSDSVPTIDEGSALTRSQFQDRFHDQILGSASLRGAFSP